MGEGEEYGDETGIWDVLIYLCLFICCGAELVMASYSPTSGRTLTPYGEGIRPCARAPSLLETIAAISIRCDAVDLDDADPSQPAGVVAACEPFTIT